MKTPIRLETFKEFHALVPKIVKAITAHPALAQRALANPLLAIEELGYQLSDTVQWEIERYVRYSRTSRKALTELENEIGRLIGKKIDPHNEAALEETLFVDLNLKRPRNSIRLSQVHPREAAHAKIQAPIQTPVDPLHEIVDAHPAVRLIIQYREVIHRTAPLATREQYEELKSGKRTLPVGKITITFTRDPAYHEEVDHA